jgi:hypothetical protein
MQTFKQIDQGLISQNFFEVDLIKLYRTVDHFVIVNNLSRLAETVYLIKRVSIFTLEFRIKDIPLINLVANLLLLLM